MSEAEEQEDSRVQGTATKFESASNKYFWLSTLWAALAFVTIAVAAWAILLEARDLFRPTVIDERVIQAKVDVARRHLGAAVHRVETAGEQLFAASKYPASEGAKEGIRNAQASAAKALSEVQSLRSWMQNDLRTPVRVSPNDVGASLVAAIAVRVSVVVLVLFLFRFFVQLYQHASRLSSFYQGRARALQLIGRLEIKDAKNIGVLLEALTPSVEFGSMFESLEKKAIDLLPKMVPKG